MKKIRREDRGKVSKSVYELWTVSPNFKDIIANKWWFTTADGNFQISGRDGDWSEYSLDHANDLKFNY